MPGPKSRCRMGPLHFRPVVRGRSRERAELQCGPRHGHAPARPGNGDFKRPVQLGGPALDAVAGRGRPQVIVEGHGLEQAPRLRRLAVAVVSEHAARLGFLGPLQGDGGAKLGFDSGQRFGQLVHFGAKLIAERVALQPRQFV